jgi:hypothetical protein
MLINRFGFQESNIVMLRDDVQHPVSMKGGAGPWGQVPGAQLA